MPPKKKPPTKLSVTEAGESSDNKGRKNQDGRLTKSASMDTRNKSELAVELDEIECKDCNKVFTEEGDRIIECERCEEWACLPCSGLSENDYQFITDSNNPAIHWYCNNCNGKAISAIKSDKQIEEKCKEYFQTVRDEIAQVKCDLDTKIDDVNVKLREEISSLKDKLEENEKLLDQKIESKLSASADRSIKEMTQREERRQNLVLFNVPESDSVESEDRKMHDSVFLKDIQSAMGTNAKLSNVIRIGVYNDQNRPLRVKTSSPQDHRDMLSSAKKLQESDDFKEVYISRDMTPLERDQWKALVRERKEKQANSEKEGEQVRWIIRNNRVIKGRNKPKEGEGGEK